MAEVTTLPEHHQVVGFGTICLYRLRVEIEAARRQPIAGSNIVDEVLGLAGSASARQPYDEGRVRDLFRVKTGSGIGICFQEGEIKMIAKAVDLVVRMLAKPEQAAVCAGKLGALRLRALAWIYSDGARAGQAEAAWQDQLVAALRQNGAAPVTTALLAQLPEFARPPLGARAAQAVGRPWTESFGATAASFQEPEWHDEDPDDFPPDGDLGPPPSGHVEGW